MTENFLVTIITPVYNGAKYLKSYFEQIASLTYKKIEIIIVNDGNEDDSSDIILKYAQKDTRIRFIDKKGNAGVSQARNDALKVANGTWIFFFDCDDTFESDIVSSCVDLVNDVTDTVCYNYASVRKNGEIGQHEFSYGNDIYSKQDKHDLLSYSFGTFMSDLRAYIPGK